MPSPVPRGGPALGSVPGSPLSPAMGWRHCGFAPGPRLLGCTFGSWAFLACAEMADMKGDSKTVESHRPCFHMPGPALPGVQVRGSTRRSPRHPPPAALYNKAGLPASQRHQRRKPKRHGGWHLTMARFKEWLKETHSSKSCAADCRHVLGGEQLARATTWMPMTPQGLLAKRDFSGEYLDYYQKGPNSVMH